MIPSGPGIRAGPSHLPAIASETDLQKMKHTRIADSELGRTETGLRLEISSLFGSFTNHSNLGRSPK